jgi:hypothetical protein
MVLGVKKSLVNTIQQVKGADLASRTTNDNFLMNFRIELLEFRRKEIINFVDLRM